jgi:hypothetical protein
VWLRLLASVESGRCAGSSGSAIARRKRRGACGLRLALTMRSAVSVDASDDGHERCPFNQLCSMYSNLAAAARNEISGQGRRKQSYWWAGCRQRTARGRARLAAARLGVGWSRVGASGEGAAARLEAVRQDSGGSPGASGWTADHRRGLDEINMIYKIVFPKLPLIIDSSYSILPFGSIRHCKKTSRFFQKKKKTSRSALASSS